MSIVQATRVQSNKPDEIIALAKKIKSLVEKHGAESVRLMRLHDSDRIGEWQFVSRYSSWEVYGKVQGGLAKDAAWEKLMTQVNNIGAQTNRFILVEVDL